MGRWKILCVMPEKQKIPIQKESGFSVVPPGIEPFVSVYSNPLSDCTFVTLSFMKAIELALH